MRRLAPTSAGVCLLVVWLAYFTALQWSVVRFRLGIVVVVTSAAVLLGTALARRWTVDAVPRQLLAAAAVVSAVAAERVRFFSYMSPTEQRWAAHGVALGCLVVAAVLLRGGARSRVVAAVAATVTAVGSGAAAIVLDPAPRIDVWVTLQQAADGIAHGQNIYEMTWVDSPGIKDAFTYLPWTALLLAPGRWLAGDVRWALLLALLVGLGCTAAMGAHGNRPTGSLSRPELAGSPSRPERTSSLALAATTLLALAPGTMTQSEQAWTEPLLFACLAAWALLVHRGHAWWAVIPLALACASKQHIAVLLPILLCWNGFGPRRAIATGGLAGLAIAPWFVASPAAFVHDTITLLIGFHPIRFANTWFIAAQTELGWTPPFAVTGVIVLATLATACLAVLRRRPPLHELLGWLALVLLVANLVNKQAFYNQYWLVGSIVALAIAALPVPVRAPAAAAAGRRARPSATAR